MGRTDTSRVRRGGRKALPRLRFQFTVASRLMAALAGTAALSAALAMAAHDRSLTADLQRAAQQRLERAAEAANSLIDAHLAAMRERYRAVSGTPQLRATLELADAPTLGYYGESLRARQGAALVAFFDREGDETAVAGDAGLLPAVRDVNESSLVAWGGRAYAVVSADLRSGTGAVGRLVAAEPVRDDLVEHWSELCGAALHFARPDEADPGELTRSARSMGGLDVLVSASLAAERAALRRSRTNLLLAGSVGVGLSLLVCVLLARGFVRPILAIQHATERIRAGDLEVRLTSERRDEIGDVARAFDLMVDDLVESRQEIERHVEKLRRGERHLARAQEMARLGSFELDLEQDQPKALRASEHLRALLQVERGDAPLDPLEMFARVHPDDRDALESAVRATVESGSALRADFRLRLPDGSERIAHVEAQLSRDEQGRARRLEGTLQDVTDRRRAEEQIRYLAHYDSLTGLGNRRLFGERLGLAISQAERRGVQLGVLSIDLDHFKRINDTLGQSVGDELLRGVADRLVRSLRDSDVVARQGAAEPAISRLAGDEFTLLLSEIHDAQDLALVAVRVLDALSRPFELQGHEVVVSASIGIAAWPGDGQDMDTLLRSAGSAMTHAKERGGGQYQFYDESINVVATELLELEARIRRALAQDEFEMHYQPKVALADGRVTGFEALLRWRSPGTGILSPGQFIPVAEQCGLIVPLGTFALRAACRQLAAWQRVRGEDAVPRVSVNLSVHQFKTGRLVATVAEILAETGARPEHLELEITESAVVHDEKGVVADLERLRALGISISLDDFGTGQSSLSYLRRLPVDTLKIDMSFVRNIAESEADARLTSAIVALGQARGLRVIAEGVETEAQRRLLASWGCDEIQGFLVSPAVPADEALALALP